MAENNKEFLLNIKNKLEIDTAGNTDITGIASASFAVLAAGITTITPAAADTTDTSAYYDGEGFTDSTVTGKNITFQVAGHRVFGDPAQDYVASKFLSIGNELRTLAQWTDAQGNKVQSVVTLTSIAPFGGAANAKQTFSFTMAFNGKPKMVKAGE
ncbi:phage tail tube protein [Enterococcus hailinensis]|uniref:phage tail tube protein n=1 Tax=Enterococcus hailinensis TaxID=3238988 RepID=UPI0038B23386